MASKRLEMFMSFSATKQNVDVITHTNINFESDSYEERIDEKRKKTRFTRNNKKAYYDED